MGINANMYVLILGKENWLTQDQVTELAYKASTTFGSQRFLIRRNQNLHAINIANPVNNAVFRFSDKEQLLDVNLMERYYREGYERGDAGFLINLAEWLEFHIPKGNVWYGSVESERGIAPFNAKRRTELKQYWFEHGFYPYVTKRFKEQPTPVYCNFCNDKAMLPTGGVKTFVFMECLGCENRVIAQDGEVVKEVLKGGFIENMPSALGV